MTPQLVQGQAIGTCITVANSTDLAALSPQGMGLGTSVWNIGVGKYFALTASTAGLVTDQVVAVSGLVGVRWILSTAIPAAGSVTYAMLDATLQGAYLPSDSIVTMVAPGTDLSITGLTGDTDGDYLVQFHLICQTHNPGQVSMRPNGSVTANQASAGVLATNTGPFQDNQTFLNIMGAAGTQNMDGEFYFTSKTGRVRFYRATVYSDRGAGITQTNLISGLWNDTSTAITSLGIHCANANGFDTGSYARLRKIHNIT